jgi:hypothetical protein
MPSLTDGDLAQRIEEGAIYLAKHYVYAYQKLTTQDDAKIINIAGGCATYISAVIPPVMNRATGLGLAGPATESDMDVMEAFFAKNDCPSQIDLCSVADASLVELLGKRNYHITRFMNKHVLGISQDDASKHFPQAPSDIITEIAAGDDLDRWATIANGDLPEDGITLASLCCRLPNVHSYLAMINGEYVGCAAMLVHNGLATLFYAYTLPDFRKRGVHNALLRRRLNDAKGLDCDVAHVATIPNSQSERDIQRYGFRLAYTCLSLKQYT